MHDTPTTGITLIRNEPVQARSTARLAALLDAAAAAVDELGYERLTTAMVADRAGASIGTVYRYFPDRVAVLQSLAARNEERAVCRVIDVIAAPEHRDWLEAMIAAFDVLVDLFRVEPGFAAIRLGDVLSLRPAEGTPRNTVFADNVYDMLVRRFNLVLDADARFAFQAAMEIADALVARAFARDQHGDERYLAQARRTVASTLSEYFATPVR